MRRKNAATLFSMLFLVTAAPACLSQQDIPRGQHSSIFDSPASPPPMGWSSWNSFSNRIDSAIVIQQANSLVATGMAKVGYRYVNIDEGWWLGTRDDGGNIVVDAKQWPAITSDERPADMANIVRYIHSLGLKAGIYTDAGEAGCSFYGPDLGPPMPHTGSEGHYEQDFLQFARWGFDFVKVDWCGGNHENLDPAVQYAEIARAIERAEAATGHSLFFSICDWGKDSPWTWGPGVGGVHSAIWRTSGDIVAPIVANSPNSSRRASFPAMLDNFDKGIHPEAQHTGFYNDPDMMLLGMPGLTDAQNRVHMTLWAISGAPLLVGADLTALSPTSLASLTNPEVIAVDQDSLGLQAVKVSGKEDKLEVWVKKLAPTPNSSGRRAVVVLNRTPSASAETIRWSLLGLQPSAASVRDLWAGRNIGSENDSYTATVPAGDARMLLVEGNERAENRYDPIVPPQNATEEASAPRSKTWSFPHVIGVGSYAWVRFGYSGKSQQLLSIHVNGESPSQIAFAPVGALTSGAVTIEAKLKNGDNQITLTGDSAQNFSILFAEVLLITR